MFVLYSTNHFYLLLGNIHISRPHRSGGVGLRGLKTVTCLQIILFSNNIYIAHFFPDGGGVVSQNWSIVVDVINIWPLTAAILNLDRWNPISWKGKNCLLNKKKEIASTFCHVSGNYFSVFFSSLHVPLQIFGMEAESRYQGALEAGSRY